MLNKNIATPLYQQIVDYVREKIRSGEYQPGQLLPSEAGFCEKFGVSRITVRNAIQILVDEGLVTKHHGKGSFVTDQADHKTHEMFRTVEDQCEQSNIPVYTHIVTSKIMPPTQQLARDLQLAKEEQVIYIERLSYAASVPSKLEKVYFPANRYHFLLNRNLENIPLRQAVLEGTAFDASDIWVKNYILYVTLAGEQEAKLLNMRAGDPMFEVRSFLFLQDGQPLCYARHLLPGSICHFSLSKQENRVHLDLNS